MMPPNFTLVQLVLVTLRQTWSFNVNNIVQNEWFPIHFRWQQFLSLFLVLRYRWHTIKRWTRFSSGTLICTVKQRFHGIIRCSSRGCCLSHVTAPLSDLNSVTSQLLALYSLYPAAGDTICRQGVNVVNFCVTGILVMWRDASKIFTYQRECTSSSCSCTSNFLEFLMISKACKNK